MHIHQTAFLAPLSFSYAPHSRTAIHVRKRVRHVTATRHPRMTNVSPQSSPALKPTRNLVPSEFDWRNQWYPVVWIDDLTTAPHAFVLWGTPLVLFHDKLAGDYVVLDDVCPHRAAPLSSGRLIDTPSGTQIQCGYHGWTFDSAGKCTDIPYTDTVPKKACMEKTYPTTMWNGLVFVWFGDKPPNDDLLPIPKELRAAKNITWAQNTRRRTPVSMIVNLENLVDTAHVNWVHHDTGQGDRSRIRRDGRIESAWTEEGTLVNNIIPGYLKPGQILRVSYLPPSTICLEASVGIRVKLFVWQLPINHDECEMFALNAFVDPPWSLRFVVKAMPRWQGCSTFNMIVDGDVVLMRKQMEELQRKSRDGQRGDWADLYFLGNGRWDSPVKEYHEFMDANVAGMPWNCKFKEDLARMSMRDINDRLYYHTKDCSACSGALKWATRLLWTAGVGMTVGMVLLVASSLVLGMGVPAHRVRRAVVLGISLIASFAVLTALMMKMRKSLVYTTKAYELGH